MKRNVLAYLLLSIVLLTACERHYDYPRELLLVDSLCEVSPDSALLCLQDMSTQMLQGPEPVRRYYQLLTIRAADKAYIPHTSDSLILQLVEYYEHEGDPSLLPTAYYLAGNVYYDLENIHEALAYYHKALKQLEGTDNYLLMARTNSMIGTLLFHHDVREEALKYYNDAYTYNRKSNNIRGQVFDLRDIASVYSASHQDSLSLSYYQCAYRLAVEHNISDLANEMEAQIGKALCAKGNYEKAGDFIQKALSHVDADDTVCVYSIASIYMLGSQRKDSLEHYLKVLVRQRDYFAREFAYYHLFRIARDRRDTASAYRYIAAYKQYNDSAIKRKNAADVAKVMAIYDYSEKEKEIFLLEKKNIIHRVILCAILITVLLVAYICFRYWKKIKRRQRQAIIHMRAYQHTLWIQQQFSYQHLKEKEQEILKLKESFDTTQQELKQEIDLRESELELLRSEVELRKNRENHSRDIIKSSKFYQHLRQLLQSGEQNRSLSSNEWEEMKELAEKCYPGFCDRLYNYYPDMTLQEYRVSLAMKLKFKSIEIGALTAHSYQSIDSTCSRLFKKVMGKKGTKSDWEALILSL